MHYCKYNTFGSYQNNIARNQDMQKILFLTLYIMSYRILSICSLYIQYTSTQYLDSLLYFYFVCFPALFNFSSASHCIFEAGVLFSHRVISSFIDTFHSRFPFPFFTRIIILFYFLSVPSLILAPSIAFSTYILGNDSSNL